MIQDAVRQRFGQLYNKQPDVIVRAPGRANLIGEHTDYSDGYVMPLAIDRAVWMALSARDDEAFNLHSIDFKGAEVSFSMGQLEDDSLPHWTRPLRGAWWMLKTRKNLSLPGADIVICSDIPIGAGVSSSAAAEVAAVEAGLALVGASGLMTQVEKALMGVDIEHQFLKMPCGVMDQIASAASTEGAATLLDCRTTEMQPVSIPGGVTILLINTMVKHNLADSEWPLRRRQSEEAARILGVPALRDATPQMVEAHKDALGELLFRRAWHVVNENERTLAMKGAMEAGDLVRAGQLLNASHHSLSNDYEVSCKELDILSDLLRNQAGVYGARMMGGGFGGCAIALVDDGVVDAVLSAVEPEYKSQTGLIPEHYICHPAAGSGVVYPV